MESKLSNIQRKYLHLETHLDKLVEVKEKYHKTLIKNRELENVNQDLESQIEDLIREIEKKTEEMASMQQRNKQENTQANRNHKEQIETLKDELEKCLSKMSGLEAEERKNKRAYEKESLRLKDDLADTREELLLTKELLDKSKIENAGLKKKAQDAELSKEIPMEKNLHLISQLQTLNIQFRSK